MSIFIKNNKNFYGSIKAEDFKEEEELGRLMIDHPEIIPVWKFTGYGGSFIPITREMRLETGELDVLGIDREGTIFVIENKLIKNSDKKTVRQQGTDYVFALLDLKEYFDGWKKFCDGIKTANGYKESKGTSFQDKSLEEIIEETVGKEDSEKCLDDVKHNFEEGNYTLVVAMDRIPKNLRVSIDGWNKVVDESKYKVPAFALEVNQFKIGDETIAVASTYPYDLAEITRKKSAGKKEYNDKSFQDKYEELAEPSFTESERKIFNEFREKIGKRSSDTWYGNGRKPQFKVKFQNIGEGERDIIDLSPDGNLAIIFDNLLAYDYSISHVGDDTTGASETFKKKFEAIPSLYKIWKDTGKWNRWNKPKEWMPEYEKILKILKETEI